MQIIGESVEIDLGSARAVWFRMPATTQEPHPSETPADSFGFSFTGHKRAVIRTASGRAREIDVDPNAVFANCDEPYDWVHVEEPYEGIEIMPSAQLTAEIDEAYTFSKSGSTHVVLPPDPVFWAAATRLRQHALGLKELADLEGDELMRSLFAHMACEYFDGNPSRVNGRPLDGVRLARIVEYIDDRLTDRLSVSDLAAVASMSTSHFHAAFRRSTAMTPHEFVTARRMERAQNLLAHGATREEAARAIGYTAGHAFRRALARFGR